MHPKLSVPDACKDKTCCICWATTFAEKVGQLIAGCAAFKDDIKLSQYVQAVAVARQNNLKEPAMTTGLSLEMNSKQTSQFLDELCTILTCSLDQSKMVEVYRSTSTS
jgi:hypothetical protein